MHGQCEARPLASHRAMYWNSFFSISLSVTSSDNLELWPMNLSCHRDIDSVKVNITMPDVYIKSHFLCIIVQTHIGLQRMDFLTQPLKWSSIRKILYIAGTGKIADESNIHWNGNKDYHHWNWNRYQSGRAEAFSESGTGQFNSFPGHSQHDVSAYWTPTRKLCLQ